MNKLNKKAFTLIELLIAITLVAILSGFVFVQMNNSANTAKDTKRKADIELLASAVISYSTENYSVKPVTDNDGCTIGGDCPVTINESLEPFLAILPSDPNPGDYYVYKSDGSDCNISATLSSGKIYEYSCSDKQTTIGTPTTGVCGAASNTVATAYAANIADWPTTEYCSLGDILLTPSFPSQGNLVSWTCLGEYLGSSISCNAYRALDGVCGTAANTPATAYTASTSAWPTTEYCLSGTADTTIFTFPTKGNSFSWNCNGTYGSNASCSVYHALNGVCGSAEKSYAASTTSFGADTFCLSGALNPASDPSFPAQGGSSSWSCVGTYNGINDSCLATRVSPPIIIDVPGTTCPTGYNVMLNHYPATTCSTICSSNYSSCYCYTTRYYDSSCTTADVWSSVAPTCPYTQYYNDYWCRIEHYAVTCTAGTPDQVRCLIAVMPPSSSEVTNPGATCPAGYHALVYHYPSKTCSTICSSNYSSCYCYETRYYDSSCTTPDAWSSIPPTCYYTQYYNDYWCRVENHPVTCTAGSPDQVRCVPD